MNDKELDAKYFKFLGSFQNDFITLTEDVNILKFLWSRFVAHKINEDEFFSWVIENKDKSDVLKYFSLVSAYHEVIIIPKTTMHDVFVSLGNLGRSFPPAKKFMSRIDQRFEKFMDDIEQRVLTLPIGEKVFKTYLEKVFRNYAIDEERFLAWIKVNKDKSDYFKYFYSLLVLDGFIATADQKTTAVRDILKDVSENYPPAEALLEYLNRKFVEFLEVIEKDFLQLQPDTRVFKEFLRDRFRKWAIYDAHFFSWVFANIDMSYFAKYLCAVVSIYEVVRDPITKLEALEKLKEIEADYPPALFILGCIYHYGTSEWPTNHTQALDYFKRASENGILRANYALIRYCFGLLKAPLDIEKAMLYHGKAMTLGGNRADYILGFCIVMHTPSLSDEELERGLGYLKKAAENGCTDALEFFRKKQYETGNFGAKVKEFLERPDNSELKNEVAYREADVLLFTDPKCLSQDSYDQRAVTILQGLRGHRKSVSLLSWCLQEGIGLGAYVFETSSNQGSLPKEASRHVFEARRLLQEISTRMNNIVDQAVTSSHVPNTLAGIQVQTGNIAAAVGNLLALSAAHDSIKCR